MSGEALPLCLPRGHPLTWVWAAATQNNWKSCLRAVVPATTPTLFSEDSGFGRALLRNNAQIARHHPPDIFTTRQKECKHGDSSRTTHESTSHGAARVEGSRSPLSKGPRAASAGS